MYYKVMKFDNAAGYTGTSGKVDHPDFTQINATNAKNNTWKMEINHHGDIYEANTLRMIAHYLGSNQTRRR